MPTAETNTRKIVARLLSEGWISIGGGKTTDSSTQTGQECGSSYRGTQ